MTDIKCLFKINFYFECLLLWHCDVWECVFWLVFLQCLIYLLLSMLSVWIESLMSWCRCNLLTLKVLFVIFLLMLLEYIIHHVCECLLIHFHILNWSSLEFCFNRDHFSTILFTAALLSLSFIYSPLKHFKLASIRIKSFESIVNLSNCSNWILFSMRYYAFRIDYTFRPNISTFQIDK